MQRAVGSVRRDDSPSGGDLGQLSERTTQLLMRFGMPLCHDLCSDNETCANPPADLGGTLRYLPATVQRYRGVMMTFYQRPAWIMPTVRGCDKYDGHCISFFIGLPSHDLYDDYTFVDVPSEFVRDILHGMKNAKIKGKKVHIEIAKKEKTYGKKGYS